MADYKKLFDLTGRKALVLGAASGIGKASAEALGALGAEVHCADIDLAQAEATAAVIRSGGEGGRFARRRGKRHRDRRPRCASEEGARSHRHRGDDAGDQYPQIDPELQRSRFRSHCRPLIDAGWTAIDGPPTGLTQVG